MPKPRDTLTITFPKEKVKQRPFERLRKLAEERERSLGYVVLEAILQYLEREEKGKIESLVSWSWARSLLLALTPLTQR